MFFFSPKKDCDVIDKLSSLKSKQDSRSICYLSWLNLITTSILGVGVGKSHDIMPCDLVTKCGNHHPGLESRVMCSGLLDESPLQASFSNTIILLLICTQSASNKLL